MKVQYFSHIQKSFQFNFPEDNFSVFKERFLLSELGQIYQAIPWQELIQEFKLKPSRFGRNLLIPAQGRLALMFLKNYSGLSDRKLIEQLNGNYEWQFFCGIYLGLHRITNYKIVSQIRCELASALKIDRIEKILYNYWNPYINNVDHIVVDATCYESEVRYPTDVKLLWESVEWLHDRMIHVCRRLSIPRLRTKYLKWVARYVSYSKMRRKTIKKRTALKRSSLLLIEKLSDFLSTHEHLLVERDKKRFEVIKKVYLQQYAKFHQGVVPQERIVSLHKDYLRPIVRGKEIKKVEFGAKVNKIQIDGISFIEKIDFEAFNEGIRFKQSIYKSQSLTHIRVRIAGADAIYATNANRRFAKFNGIQTDFKPKGRKGKNYREQRQLRGMITKERASRLEGSFGKDKEHYHLRKIKAKGKENEILWIFFGIHVGNALEIGRRMSEFKSKSKSTSESQVA